MSSRETQTQSAWSKNLKMWPPLSSKKFSLKILHWPESPDPGGLRCRNLWEGKPMTERSVGKRVQISPKVESWPFVFSRREKYYCEISPKLPVLTSLHEVESVNAFAAATTWRCKRCCAPSRTRKVNRLYWQVKKMWCKLSALFLPEWAGLLLGRTR